MRAPRRRRGPPPPPGGPAGRRGPGGSITRPAQTAPHDDGSASDHPALVPTHLPLDYDKRLMLFAGRSSTALAGAIGHRLGVESGHVDLQTYANGEVYCRYEESVRGAAGFVVPALP